MPTLVAHKSSIPLQPGPLSVIEAAVTFLCIK